MRDPNANKHTLDGVTVDHRNLAREVSMVPFDPAPLDGILSYLQLGRATHRA